MNTQVQDKINEIISDYFEMPVSANFERMLQVMSLLFELYVVMTGSEPNFISLEESYFSYILTL